MMDIITHNVCSGWAVDIYVNKFLLTNGTDLQKKNILKHFADLSVQYIG